MRCDADQCDSGEEGARFQLQYSIDWKLLETDPDYSNASDMEQESCERHLSDMNFVFDPNHGLPQRVYDLIEDRERPDLLEEIEAAYERWRKKDSA